MLRILSLKRIIRCNLPCINISLGRNQHVTCNNSVCDKAFYFTQSVKSKIKNEYYNFFRSEKKTNKIYAFTFTVTGLLEFLGLKDEDEDSELIKILKRAELCYAKKEYDQSEQLFHIALKIAQELLNDDAETYIFDRLANIAFDRGDNENARKLFVEVIKRLLSKGMERNDTTIIHINFKLAKLLENMGEFQLAESGYEYCFSNIEPKLNKDNDEHQTVKSLYLMLLNGYAHFNYKIGKLDRATDYFSKALDLCLELNGKIHEESVLLLNNLGTIKKQKGDIDSALNYFHLAEEIGKNLPDMKNFSYIYLNLAYLNMEKAILSNAKHYCNKALVNSTRNGFEEGIKESNECLEKVKELSQVDNNSKV